MNRTRSTRKNPAAAPATDLDGADLVEHIMVEHGQFLTLLDSARVRLQAFLDGETTLGAIQRLTDEITKALPATLPTGVVSAPSLVGGAK